MSNPRLSIPLALVAAYLSASSISEAGIESGIAHALGALASPSKHMTPNECIPLDRDIGFEFRGAGIFNNGYGIAVGTIPTQFAPIGKVRLSSVLFYPHGKQFTAINTIGSSLRLDVERPPGDVYGTGLFNLGKEERQDARDKVAAKELDLPGVTYSEKTGVQGEICASGLAFHVNNVPNTSRLHQGKAYLYLNRTQQFIEVWF